MNDFERIEKYDLDIIEEMIDKVDEKEFINLLKLRLPYKQASEIAGEILYKWAVNKSHLYKILGRNLKVKKSDNIQIDENQINTSINELISELPQFKHFLESFSPNEFINNKMNIPEQSINDFVCYGSIASYSKTFVKTIGARDGMKITKLANKCYKHNDLNIAISKITQEKEIEMFFYVSIDPIDILTASMNKSNWRSCHNFKDGQYKNGTLVYLYDNCSLIGFSSSKDEPIKICGDAKALNKNWRQMISFDDETLAQLYSRQYPNTADHKSKIIRGIFSDLVCEYFDVEDKWTKRKANSSDVSTIFTSFFYCDVSHGSIGSTTVLRRSSFKECKPNFKIGHNKKNKFLELNGNEMKQSIGRSVRGGTITFDAVNFYNEYERILNTSYAQPVDGRFLSMDIAMPQRVQEERSEADGIRRRIQELRRQSRRGNTYLETQSINREIATLERELRFLRMAR